MRTLVLSIATLASLGGLAGAQYYPDHTRNWRDDRLQTEREQARINYERRLARCGDSRWCRRHARREFRRDLARMDRYRF